MFPRLVTNSKTWLDVPQQRPVTSREVVVEGQALRRPQAAVVERRQAGLRTKTR